MAVGVGTKRAQYQIEVRDYTWRLQSVPGGAVQSLRVQSPHLEVQGVQGPFVVRQVDTRRNHKYEKAQHACDLRDNIGQSSYDVSAHGVLVVEPDDDHVQPLWISQQQFNIQDPKPIEFVNLSTYDTSELPCSQICWVPTLRRPDGGLITLLLAGKPFGVAVCQELCSPGSATLVQVTTKELASYEKLEEQDQRRLFDLQLRAVRKLLRAPTPASPVRVPELTAPDIIMKRVELLKKSTLLVRPLLQSSYVLEEDLEVPGFDSSSRMHEVDSEISTDYSSDDESDCSDFNIDDEPLFPRASSARLP